MSLGNILAVVIAIVASSFAVIVGDSVTKETSREATPPNASLTPLETIVVAPPFFPQPSPSPALPTPPETPERPAEEETNSTETQNGSFLPLSPPNIVQVQPTSVEEINSSIKLLRGALVNIVCLPKNKALRAVSGTGIVVDSKGIVLTVAHIAQYFAFDPLRDRVSCYLRTGSPATIAYQADLIYLSESWLADNESVISDERPVGTGQYDFALLGITRRIQAAPATFTSASLAQTANSLTEKERVTIGSYGAEFLSSDQVQTSLYPTIVFGTVDTVYTFDENMFDLFSVQIGAAAQEGSSGGAILDQDDTVVGLITTRTSEKALSARSIHAITIDHIRRTFEDETGDTLEQTLQKELEELIEDFSKEKEKIREQLLTVIRQ